MIRHARQGFTLIELVVVILIIALLMALLMPAIRRVPEAGNLMKCQSNLRQLMMAMHNYHADSGRKGSPGNLGDRLPEGCIGAGTTPEKRMSWMVTILPYLESETVHKQINLERGFADNRQALNVKMKQFHCVSATEELAPATHYVAIAGVGLDAASKPTGAPGIGFMGYDRRTTLGQITAADGTSSTIGLMETRADLGHWARGGFNTLRGYDPATMKLDGENPAFSGHANGTNAVMVDASVRQIRKTIDPKVLSALLTISGGERVDLTDVD